MQEYCYKSTRKEATRALLKVVLNNLKDKKIFKRRKFRKRYLPHDPNMILESTIINESTIMEQPVTIEALNLPPNLAMEQVEACCSSGFHSVSSTSQSPVQNEKNDFKERQTQFNSILQTIEKENSAVLERLTSLQASRNKIESNIHGNGPKANVIIPEACPESESESLTQPIENCVAMQAQLNRLKLLIGGLFEFEENLDDDGSETPLRSKKQIVDHRQSILMELQNSLNDPSLIESTPVVAASQLKNAAANHQFLKKKLSRLALDNNFSPIVYQVCICTVNEKLA